MEKTSEPKTVPSISGQNPGKRLRIYIGESDRWRGKPLDTVILEAIRAQGLAGATVFRGVSGFGAHSHIRTTSIEVLSIDLPVVIEVVDIPERIQRALDAVSPMVQEGLVTLEDVTIVKYTHRYLNPLPVDRLVSEVMTRDVVSLKPEMTVRDAWQKMIRHAVKAMPVVDGSGCVIGLLTDEDLIDRGGIFHRLSVTLQLPDEDIQKTVKSLETTALTVAEVMTRPVVTIAPEDSLGSAAHKMVHANLKRLPVVDAGDHLVGMLSRLDILKQLVELPAQTIQQNAVKGAGKTVRDIIQTELPTINREEPIGQIAEKFVRSGTHRLIVVDDEKHAIGMISDSDLVARSQPEQRYGILGTLRNIGKPPAARETAEEIMSPGVVKISPDATITECVNKMLAENRKWLMVVDEKGNLRGFVDREGLLRALVI